MSVTVLNIKFIRVYIYIITKLSVYLEQLNMSFNLNLLKDLALFVNIYFFKWVKIKTGSVSRIGIHC